MPNLTSHGRNGYRYGCRCEVCTEGQRVGMNEYMARRKERDGVHPATAASRIRREAKVVEVECFLCKETLKRPPAAARYPMHKKCRYSAPNWMRLGRDKPNLRREAFQRKIDRAARGTSSTRVFTCGACKWCGEQFVGIGIYCSKKCSAAVKFRRQSSGRTFNISPRARLAIYERDGWTCQLCTFPVEQGLHYLNDWAPSLDHVIPRSATLVPDHSPSNLQLAHRMCNSMKGDGSNMTEVELHQRIADHFSFAA